MNGIYLDLDQVEREILIEATEKYIYTASLGEKPFYILLLNKLSRKQIFVDGMYMRCMEQVLDKKAMDCHLTNVSAFCSNLSKSIRIKREHFQNDFMNVGT